MSLRTKSSPVMEMPADESTVSALVEDIITQALMDRASDIHLEPVAEGVIIRFRIDGLLRHIDTIPKHLKNQVTSHVKVLADLDIAERRVPQDGRVTKTLLGNKVDLRVSTLPVYHGEKVVVRLLPQNKSLVNLEDTGFSSDALEVYKTFLDRSQGLIMLTGPTGSGKTSTLYASLNRLRRVTHNIVTIEDPVEYLLEGINQVQVHTKAGLTFAGGLRSILRQDPDIIMVGEIRDRETSQIVFQSALTGHLVLSTLHTNDTVSAITRLVDMGVEHFLIGSALIGVVAQRLVRKICPHCQESYVPEASVVALIKLPVGEYSFKRGKGCQHCGDTGYFGREAIIEIFPITHEIQAMIHERMSEQKIRDYAISKGMKTLAQAATDKVLEGKTTVEELMRVVIL